VNLGTNNDIASEMIDLIINHAFSTSSQLRHSAILELNMKSFILA